MHGGSGGSTYVVLYSFLYIDPSAARIKMIHLGGCDILVPTKVTDASDEALALQLHLAREKLTRRDLHKCT